MTTCKTFSLSSCDWIGFDLDHTLIRYRLLELHTLIYQLLCEYLVQTFHYDDQLLQIPYDDYFGVKALIYDSLYGNLIQLNCNGFVHTALHGVHTRLSSERIREIYPETFEDIEEDTSKRFLCIFTYFEHCTSYLIANIVDLIDQGKCLGQCSEKNNYSFFLTHFGSGFDYLFGDFNRGKYFSSIHDTPEKYLYPRHDVRQWLEKARKAKKKFFLATNSRFDYTNLLTSFAFGNDWQDLFDVIIVDCKKPLFFSDCTKREFHQLINENEFIPVTTDQIIRDVKQNYIYAHGNSEDLHTIMSAISEKDPLVIYFGDHIKSDINALKRHTNWLAGVILEELEFDSPSTSLPSTSRLALPNERSYLKGNRSKYFSSFFTSPGDSNEVNSELDTVAPALSSYWYTYITKHAHFTLSCLSVLANHFDLDHPFEHDQQANHFLLLHQNK